MKTTEAVKLIQSEMNLSGWSGKPPDVPMKVAAKLVGELMARIDELEKRIELISLR